MKKKKLYRIKKKMLNFRIFNQQHTSEIDFFTVVVKMKHANLWSTRKKSIKTHVSIFLILLRNVFLYY